MKEKLYTIPLNDAVNAGDECPFCYIERNVEQDLMDFVLGSCASYMESDVREDTDREGFCRTHMKKMFDYGNTLGNRFQKEYERYLDTFFYLYEKDPDFKARIAKSKGFCLHHFGELCSSADTRLSEKEKETFFPEIFEIMQKNMARMSADVDWLIEKFDYQNKDADWKNSKDAIQRGMQNIRGGYPADPVYKMNK